MVWNPVAFKDWLLREGRSRGTADAYAGEARRLARFVESSGEGDLGAGIVGYVTEPGYSAATSCRRRAAMVALARFLGLEILSPPLPRIAGPRSGGSPVPTPEPSLPAPGAVADLALPSRRHRGTWSRDRALSLLILGLGLTPSRLQRLQLQDVVVEDGRAWLAAGPDGSLLPLPALLRRAVLAWLAVRPEPLGLDEPLFTGRGGGLLPLRTLQSGVSRLLGALGPGFPAGSRGVRQGLLVLARSSNGEEALTARALVGRLPGRMVKHRGVEALLGSLRRRSRTEG